MQILGLKFTWRKKPVPPPQEAHASLGLTYKPLEIPAQAANSGLFSGVDWPSPDQLDEFQQLSYQHLLTKFANGMINARYSGHFSICAVREIRAMFHGDKPMTRYAKKCYESLSHLHCIDWANIPPDTLVKIPAMLSAVIQNYPGPNQKDDYEEGDTFENEAPILSIGSKTV